MTRIEEINARKAEIRTMLQSDKKVDLDALEKELRALDDEQQQIERRAKIAAGIQEGKVPAKQVQQPNQPDKRSLFDTEEYRTAFMNYVLRREAMPVQYRANATTSTEDVGAVVPPVTLNKIVKRIETYGMILPLVNHTAYKTGMNIPVASVKPTATWVAEGAGSDKQKLAVDGITFGHYKLRCAVSVTLETENMALSAFETYLVDSIGEAMAKALEQAILNGTGSGQPTGILADADKGTTLNLKALTYKDLTKAEAALPMEYENNAVWVMSKKTFMEFVGMVDSQGQPVARVNYGIAGAPERSLLGRKVVLTNYLPAFSDTLKKTDVFAMIYNFGDYALNTNYSVTVKTYEDNDTDDTVRKSIMIVDGKPVQYDSLVKLCGTVAAG